MKQLLAIQQELKAPKDLKNTFGNYNYRSCEGILEALKPLLEKQKCTLTLSDTILNVDNVPQTVITDETTKPKTKTLVNGQVMFVQATATITCGDESVSVSAQAGIDVNKAGMDVAQCFGASSSYARKYALNGLLLIDDTKDADTTNTHEKEKPTEKVKHISEAQGKKLGYECSQVGIKTGVLAEHFKISRLSELRADQMTEALEFIASHNTVSEDPF